MKNAKTGCCRRALIATVLASLLAALAGCGERQQVARHDGGSYEGKRDGRSWQGHMRSRAENQNEYQLMNR